jgi:aminoglycoside phosphotransferase (APT) family kinase protein
VEQPRLEPNAVTATRLVRSQFPQWAHLPCAADPQAGTDNAIFRLGDELAVRLPKVFSSSDQLAKETIWLPRLGPGLPLAVPRFVGVGEPDRDYPWHWAVYEWIPGASPNAFQLPDPSRTAVALATFIRALQTSESSDGPPPNIATGFRGADLSARDQFVRSALAERQAWMDTKPVLAAWERALAVPPWSGPPRWIHGDLHPGNLLFDETGAATGVIDWGAMAVGDPACDLMIAWNLPGDARATFRSIVDVDDDSWERGRGAALFQWIGGIQPGERHEALRVIERVLEQRAT